MRGKKEGKDDSFNPMFKNTRSRLYVPKPSFEKQQKSNPNDNGKENSGGYWKQKGNQAFKAKNYDQAILYYTKAIQINPGESQYFSNRSKCYQKKGKLELSLKDAEAACELDESNIKAHYTCGCILAEMGKIDDSKLSKAENRLKKALRLCRTQNTPQYQEDISIKLFRLKKLIYFRNIEKELRSIQQEEEIAKRAFSKGQITKDNYENIVHRLEREREQLRQNKQIPDFLICKISLMLMEDPVLSEGGFSYERKLLEEYYETKGPIEPITRKKVTGKIYPNHALKQAIEQFLKDNPWAFQEEKGEDYHNIPFM